MLRVEDLVQRLMPFNLHWLHLDELALLGFLDGRAKDCEFA